MEPDHTIKQRYRIQREIGRGCFGVVYLAEDLDNGEQRAIKILLPGVKSDESLRRRLRREAKYAGQLKSPHAVRIFETDETDDGNVFLVMEYLQGRELTQVLRENGTLPPERVTRIAEQILHALEDAHTAGVIHRDLKPSNIFLLGDTQEHDRVKVFDFGIAKAAREGSIEETRQLTQLGGVLGTPVYMSPEQCRGGDVTPASDLYSLGVVLYELLTGQPPFDDENPVRVMMLHNTEAVPPLPDAIAESDLGRAILRALEKEPEARFASAAEFRAAMLGESPVASAQPMENVPRAEKETVPLREEARKTKTSFLSSLFRMFRGKK